MHSMWSLLQKEVNTFLNSLIGYIVIALFLLAIGLFMWIFPGQFNVLDAGYSNIDTLFVIAPWVFIFLAPAVTMRSFSEEFRTGSIELLLTKPLTDWQIILSKYLAAVLLVVFAILPTLIYYFSIGKLGMTPFNMDKGATWGSYLGLLFLASAFVSIGVFASSLSSSQIVSFIIGVFLSFFVYIGFESISSIPFLQNIEGLLLNLGINEHYISMSRGVIDTRDVLYFLGLNTVFILLTKTRIESRRW